MLAVDASGAISRFGKIAICTEKVDRDAQQVQRLVKNYFASYEAANNRTQRQQTVLKSLREYVASLKQSS